MLVDVKLGGMHPVMAGVLGCSPRRVERGVYDGCGFNFGNDVADKGFEDFFYEDNDPYVPSYGVADSIEQCMGKLRKTLEDSPHEFAIGFTEVRRADQSREGGWRWHKWGEYIGTREPQCEYLHDEPEIESVVTFSVVRRKRALTSVESGA